MAEATSTMAVYKEITQMVITTSMHKGAMQISVLRIVTTINNATTSTSKVMIHHTLHHNRVRNIMATRILTLITKMGIATEVHLLMRRERTKTMYVMIF